MTRWPSALTGALALLLILQPAAARADWFDDYARAVQLLGQRQGARAAEYLERAIRRRPEPGANIPTYGTNRLESYYPYLRLAQAYMLAGDPERAQEALRRSQAYRGSEPADQHASIAAVIENALENRRPAGGASPATVATNPPQTAATLPAPPPASVVARPSPIAPPTRVTRPAAGATGTLDLRTDPDGAAVFAGNRLLGTTPLHVDLPTGDHMITLRKEGTADQRFPVKIEAGQTMAPTPKNLIAAGPPPSAPGPGPTAPPPTTALMVESDPGGAAVYLDDVLVGTTDPVSGRLVKPGVEPGNHRIRVAHAGYHEVMERREITPVGPTVFAAKLAAVAPPKTDSGLAPVLSLAALAGLGLWAWSRRWWKPAS